MATSPLMTQSWGFEKSHDWRQAKISRLDRSGGIVVVDPGDRFDRPIGDAGSHFLRPVLSEWARRADGTGFCWLPTCLGYVTPGASAFSHNAPAHSVYRQSWPGTQSGPRHLRSPAPRLAPYKGASDDRRLPIA